MCQSSNRLTRTDFFDGLEVEGAEITSPSLIEAALSPSVPTFGGAKLPFDVDVDVDARGGVSERSCGVGDRSVFTSVASTLTEALFSTAGRFFFVPYLLSA